MRERTLAKRVTVRRLVAAEEVAQAVEEPADPVADRRPANALDALSWLMLPENAWQEWAARPIPDRLPEMTTSGEFVRLEAGAAARALDGFTDSSAAPATVIDGAAVRRRPTVKAWIAAPAALAAAIAAASVWTCTALPSAKRAS